MLQSIVIWKAGLSASVPVNEFTTPFFYPVHKFEWDQPTRGDELPKMEDAGQHDRYSDIDNMPITMEGHFLSDNTTQYWTIRKALLGVIIPTPGHLYRYTSHIQIKLDGDSETYWANVTLKDHDAPLEANYPTVTPFQFQWENPFGYWRKLSNNAVAYI